MNKLTIKQIGPLVIGVLFVLMCILSAHLSKTGARSDFKEFTSANLRGRISSISASTGGEHLVLEDPLQIYTFHSDKNEANDFKHFYEVAEIGDSVVKPVLSDTVWLFTKKTNRVYTFTFMRPQQNR